MIAELITAGVLGICCLFGALHERRKRHRRQALDAYWNTRDLTERERDANRELYELDPALAVELGYEPPSGNVAPCEIAGGSREVEFPTGVLGETTSHPYAHLLEPGLARAFKDDRLMRAFAQGTTQQREIARRLGALGSFGQQAQQQAQQQAPGCTCGASWDPMMPGSVHRSGCPKRPH